MAKKISSSVGKGGKNAPASVAVVQYLLNCVPAAKGGPTRELAVDGLIGPKTIGAIQRFQLKAFGRADGRVDPGQRTIGTLQQFDPFPNQQLGVGGGKGGTAAGIAGAKMPGPPGATGPLFPGPGKAVPGKPFPKKPAAPGKPFPPKPGGKSVPGKLPGRPGFGFKGF